MSKVRRVREVVSRPYAVESAFHRASTGVPVDLEWIAGVLSRSYGLTLSLSQVREFEGRGSVSGTSKSFVTETGDPVLIVGIAGISSLADSELLVRQILLAQHTATYGLVTDGVEFVFLRRRHDVDRCDYAPDLPKLKVLSDLFELLPSTLILQGAEAENGKLETALFNAHCAVRDVEGMHDDEALDELCKLLFTILAENTKEQAKISTEHRSGSHPMIAAATIRGSYSRAGNSGDEVVSGGVFASPIRLSDSSLLRAWKSLTTVDLANYPGDLKGRAFQRILDPAIRAGMGQFFTPDPVVEFMVHAISPEVGESVLDPFCGSAHFLSRTIRFAMHRADSVSPSCIQLWMRTMLHGIEKSERMIRIAQTDRLLNDGAYYSIHRYDSLSPFNNFADLKAGSFDIVLTNPPFGSLLSADTMDSIGPFELAKSKGTTPVDVLGLERSVEFLRPGGRIAIVLPEGVFSNQRMRHVRYWLQEHLKIVALVSLPVCTFAPYGANVRTTVLFGVKCDTFAPPITDTVLIAGADNVGYDASGRPTSDPSDLLELADVVRAAFGTVAGEENVA